MYKPTSLERIQFLANKTSSTPRDIELLLEMKQRKSSKDFFSIFSIEDSCEILNAIQIHNNTKILSSSSSISHGIYEENLKSLNLL